MIYVMGDIRGDYDKYIDMLDNLALKETDTLYVTGNIIGDGAEYNGGIDILMHMMCEANIYPILGENDYIFTKLITFLMSEITEESVKKLDDKAQEEMIEWINIIGAETVAEFKMLDREDQEAILDYMSEFALYEEVECKGKEYIIVNAGFDNFDPEKSLEDYTMDEILKAVTDYSKTYFEDKILVTGATPTDEIDGAKRGFIYMENNHIAVDCGCGFEKGRLATVCLDTGDAYYTA